MTIEHKDAALGQRHAPHNFEPADAAARLAIVTTTADINKTALQLDTRVTYRVIGAGTGAGVWETPTPGPHTHAQSEVTGLVAALAAKPNATLDTDATLSGNSDGAVATQKAVKTYVDSKVAGLLSLKGSIDCSTNPNYPAATKGDTYMATVAGFIGGASAVAVDAGDFIIAMATNAGGNQAAVGASWTVLEHNLIGNGSAGYGGDLAYSLGDPRLLKEVLKYSTDSRLSSFADAVRIGKSTSIVIIGDSKNYDDTGVKSWVRRLADSLLPLTPGVDAVTRPQVNFWKWNYVTNRLEFTELQSGSDRYQISTSAVSAYQKIPRSLPGDQIAPYLGSTCFEIDFMPDAALPPALETLYSRGESGTRSCYIQRLVNGDITWTIWDISTAETSTVYTLTLAQQQAAGLNITGGVRVVLRCAYDAYNGLGGHSVRFGWALPNTEVWTEIGQATFTAAISTAGLMTVTGTPTGVALGVGSAVVGPLIPPGTRITALGTGTGGTGTYTVAPLPTTAVAAATANVPHTVNTTSNLAVFNATIAQSVGGAPSVMTVNSVASGTLAVGQIIANDVAGGGSIKDGLKITALGTGTGGTGTYTVDWAGLGTIGPVDLAAVKSIPNPDASVLHVICSRVGNTTNYNGRIYGIKIKNGIYGRNKAPANIDSWLNGIGGTFMNDASLGGVGTINVFSCCYPGSLAFNWLARPAMFPFIDQGIVLCTSSADNENTSDATSTRTMSYQVDLLRTSLEAYYPQVPIGIVMHNMNLVGSSNPMTNNFRHGWYNRYWSKKGYPLLDFASAFLRMADRGSSLFKSDQQHPTNSTPGSDGQTVNHRVAMQVLGLS